MVTVAGPEMPQAMETTNPAQQPIAPPSSVAKPAPGVERPWSVVPMEPLALGRARVGYGEAEAASRKG